MLYNDQYTSMIELFAQLNLKNGKSLPTFRQTRQLRPYIAACSKNITVACYLGRDCQAQSNEILPYRWSEDKASKDLSHKHLAIIGANGPKNVRYCGTEKFV